MPLPSSGQIAFSNIATELTIASSNLSLRSMSSTAGKAVPDSISEFYNYSHGVSADYLVIAGGGSGGWGGGNSGYGGAGGGGAGGYKEGALTFNRNVSYAITVGGGGPAQDNMITNRNGSPSSIASLVTTAGGGTGAADWYGGNIGTSGGSGGGSHINIYSRSEVNQASGISGQGYAGGPSYDKSYTDGDAEGGYYTKTSENPGGGGGGGAGGAGGVWAPAGLVYAYEQEVNGGPGGVGIVSSITGTAIGRGGGGGGGGLRASSAIHGGSYNIDYGGTVQAVVNTGGGGKGSNSHQSFPNNTSGASGVVIIRILSSVASSVVAVGASVSTYSIYTVYTFNGSGTIQF